MITGSPATFEMKRPDSDEIMHAQAGRLEYDFVAGVVEFSDQAVITGDGNQISSNYLVYNIREQRISAQSGGAGDPKVRITYTPGPTTGPATGAPGTATADDAENPDATADPVTEDAGDEEVIEDVSGEPNSIDPNSIGDERR
jgi:hypothetical protein